MSQSNPESSFVPASQDLLEDVYLETLCAYDTHAISVTREVRRSGDNFQTVASLALSTLDGANLVLEQLEHGRQTRIDGR